MNNLLIVLLCILGVVLGPKYSCFANEYLDLFEIEGTKTTYFLDSSKLDSDRQFLYGSIVAEYDYMLEKNKATNGTVFKGATSMLNTLEVFFKSKLTTYMDVFISGRASYDPIYSIKGRNEFTSDLIRSQEFEVDLGESFIQTNIKGVDLKLGRQIMSWGSLDTFRIVDLINPLDLRKIGYKDFKDLKLPIGIIKLIFPSRLFTISTVLIAEQRFNKIPSYGSEYYVSQIAPLSSEKETFKVTGGVNLNKQFLNGDVSLYLARFYQDNQHIEQIHTSELILKRNILNLSGISASWRLFDFIIKSDLAYYNNVRFSNLNKYFNQFKFGLGFDYSKFENITLTGEVALEHTIDYENKLKAAPDYMVETDILFNFSTEIKSFREQVVTTIFYSHFGKDVDSGSFIRPSIAYYFTDKYKFEFGSILYFAGTKEYSKQFNKNDRIFVKFETFFGG
ncbi:hypothetical protein DID76_01585 [Candidatus Marinamargulisbacteria bacterium SCGC AG-414-C22]|nr:hypothetical protein DID76_01585 [Candidatus Marinamargulisbacteria bacterium SCGC AG-414-C22]